MKSLARIVQTVVNETDLADPREITDHLLTSISDEEMGEVLRSMVVSNVRMILGQIRISSQNQVRNANGDSRWEKIEFSLMEMRICISRNVWKKFGECTPHDVRLIAQSRQQEAESILAIADQYTDLADAMEKGGVKTVKQMNSEDIRQIFGNNDKELLP